MQKIMGYIRKACQEFDLIENGDRIAVGVSGGKDSLALLAGLAGMRRFAEFSYELVAITLDPGFNGQQNNYEEVARLCEKLDVPFKLVHTNIGEIVFDIRKEPNPCSLCAKLRRGALHDAAIEAGCNKIALGHHKDDVIETFIMNLFKEGRVGCFAPKTYLSRKQITMIRPLVFAPESQIISACNRNNLEVVKSVCPADKNTTRETTKQFLNDMEHKDRGFKLRIFTALRKSGVNGWGFKDARNKDSEEAD
ncbi:MAG: tRNA 2-thiocytidine biosynthesis protein TtcA [Ruminiclostridium sp.]|nr:tRNA 2-thiocytidine biosynthesis protein TtcA [Ruminiclostridium sp.]